MKEWRVIEATDPKQWDDFVSQYSQYQYVKWTFKKIIKAAFGHNSLYLLAVNENNEVGAALPLVQTKSMLFGNLLTSMPFLNYGGLMGPESKAKEAILKYCEDFYAKDNCKSITIREDQELTDASWQCLTHKVTMILTLPETADELGKAIGSKRRSQIRRSAKEGAYTKVGKAELLDDFYLVFAENMRDLGTPVYSKKWFSALFDNIAEHCHLVVVYLHDMPVAACFLIRHQDQMEIPWASSLRSANKFSVNMALYWEALSFSIEQGAKTFDFGRCDKNSNTQKFKKQWGSEEHQLFWYQYTGISNTEVQQLNPKSGKFEKLVEIWQKLPLQVANVVGPHIVKNIP